MSFKNFISDAEKKLPPLVRDADIEKLGLFSKAQLTRARKEGNGCPFLKARGRYFYFKEDVLHWIESMFCAGVK